MSLPLLPGLLRLAGPRSLAVDRDQVAVPVFIGFAAEYHLVRCRRRHAVHTVPAVADQKEALFFFIPQVERAGQPGHLQGHGHADTVKILQRVVFLGQIKKGLEKIIEMSAEVIAVITGGFFTNPAADSL